MNYKYRMYDSRVGRFFAVDPLASKYPHNSPYAFSENRVIDGVELEGLEYVNVNTVINDETGQTFLEFANSIEGYDYETVSHNGEVYIKVNFHLWKTDDNRLSFFEGEGKTQITEWVYTDINNFNEGSDHVYDWADPSVTGGIPVTRDDGRIETLWNNENCAVLANEQAEELGTDLMAGCVSESYIIETYNAQTGTVLNTDQGIDYINRQLEDGKVVVVGVDDGNPGGTDTGRGTDHFVTIVGRGSNDDGTGFFFFIENATSGSGSTNFRQNRFTPGTGDSGLGGGSSWGGENSFEITRIQENKD